MALLRIQLFGAVRVSHADQPRDARLIHTVQALLAWLVLNRRKTHAREALAGIFWGEQREDRARSCLSTALWRLKQAIEPDGVPQGAYLISDSRSSRLAIRALRSGIQYCFSEDGPLVGH